jgi:hypothetical protein
MAITHTQTQITWSAASTRSITSATEVESDGMTIDATTVALSLQLSADNAGTPASGDTAVFTIKWSTGDVLANSGDDYDTSEYAQLIAVLDTYATNTPGEDPARVTVPVQPLATKFKLAVVCANAATRNMTVAARMDEQRAA